MENRRCEDWIAWRKFRNYPLEPSLRSFLASSDDLLRRAPPRPTKVGGTVPKGNSGTIASTASIGYPRKSKDRSRCSLKEKRGKPIGRAERGKMTLVGLVELVELVEPAIAGTKEES